MQYYRHLFLLLFSLFSFFSVAQNTSIGIKGGLNLADLAYENDLETSFKPGLLVGGFITYSTDSGFGFGGELNYVMRGTELVDQNITLNYLELPLYVKYFFGQPGEKLRPKVMLGPSLGFLLSADAATNDVSENFETIDAGLMLAGGVNYSLGGGKWLNLDLRYTYGLTNISAFENAPEVFNRNLALTVGVSFPLGNY